MVEADSLTCPDCGGPLLAVYRGGYFCRSCQIAISLSEGWAHILGPSLSERRLRLHHAAP